MATPSPTARAITTLASRRLNWNITTTALFAHFAHSDWAILLDSANATHPDANYDIICAHPIATLVTDGQTSNIDRCDPALSLYPLPAELSARTQTDPFTVLNTLLTHWYPQRFDCHLPFSGGAMGSFSYDLGRRIERMPNIAARDIDLPEMNIGFYDWALIYDYQDKHWYLVHYLGEDALNEQLAHLETFIHTQVSERSFVLNGAWAAQITYTQYQQKFAAVQTYLQQGDCYQINLTQRFSAPYQGDEWRAYCRLREANQAPFSAFMRLKHHAILSISPERFIKLTERHIQTKPIKGTLPRHACPIADQQAATALKHSAKDRAENVMIVDLLRNDMGKVATPGSVQVPKLFDIESFPAVHHLVSTITAALDPRYHACDLLRAAFPGGSITGAPKIRAMEIIETLEPSRRSLYCGSIGYISQDGHMDSSITIRTLVAAQGKLYCWAGGGIVIDSQVNAEYQESFDKVSRILPLLSDSPKPILPLRKKPYKISGNPA